MYDLFMPGLSFLIRVYLPLPLRQHSFVRSPSTVPSPRLPFLSISLNRLTLRPTPPRRHPPVPFSYNVNKHNSSPPSLHAYPFAVFPTPSLPLPITYSYLSFPLHPLLPPPLGLSISHPSLTLCICYMILHRPAVCGHSHSPFGYLKPPEKPLWCIPSSGSI